jgi:putative DNA primase/helicase
MTATRLEAFRQEIEKAGLISPSVIPLGKLIRFPGIGKSKGNTSGWAFLFEDGLGGAYGDWASGLSDTWHAQHDHAMTAVERAAHARRVADLRRIRQEEEARQHIDAAQRAQQLWDGAKPAPRNHAYLIRKGIQPHGLRVDAETRLIVPVMIGGSIASLQTIDANGGKLFFDGGKTKGGSFTIGNLTEPETILICEGYATGASLYEAAGRPVVVAFSAGNLTPVAVQLRAQCPTATIVVCGDQDLSGTGQQEARKAADAVGGVVALPEAQGQDFNDVHIQRGLDAVRACVENAMCHATVTPGAPTTASRAVFRRVADVQAQPIRWLWPGRIAQGKVSIIAGNPGLGKSQVTVSMAATVSTGGLWPVDGKCCEVGNVIILSAEDDPSDTIRPRLEASGADLSRVFILDAVLDGPLVSGGETPRAFNLKTDIDQLGSMLKEIGGAALVIIDPITAYLGTTDSHKNAEIRALLSPLAELAGQYGTAVVAVSHFNKNANTEALMRVTGSLAFVAAARAAYVVARDPESEARRLFLPLKNNLGNDQSGLAFTVESVQVESAIGMIETSRVVWESSAVTVTAEEAMKPQVHDDERSDLDDAKDFLRELLTDGPIPSKQIRGDAEGAGHAWRTIQRAQKALGVVAFKKGMKEGWLWKLDTPSRSEECHEPPKDAVPGAWQPSYSSGSLGGLHGNDTILVEGGRLGPSSQIAATSETPRDRNLYANDLMEVIDLDA